MWCTDACELEGIRCDGKEDCKGGTDEKDCNIGAGGFYNYYKIIKLVVINITNIKVV